MKENDKKEEERDKRGRRKLKRGNQGGDIMRN